jgi:hydrogenase maturation protease
LLTVSARLPVPVLVIGVGNDLRGDDAAGLLVAQEVARWGRPGVLVLETRQLVPELAPEIATLASLVVVDAAVSGPDTPACEATAGTPGPLTHTLALAELLALAGQLGGGPPIIRLVPIPAVQFDYGTAPSATCVAGMATALQLLSDLLPGSE